MQYFQWSAHNNILNVDFLNQKICCKPKVICINQEGWNLIVISYSDGYVHLALCYNNYLIDLQNEQLIIWDYKNNSLIYDDILIHLKRRNNEIHYKDCVLLYQQDSSIFFGKWELTYLENSLCAYYNDYLFYTNNMEISMLHIKTKEYIRFFYKDNNIYNIIAKGHNSTDWNSNFDYKKLKYVTSNINYIFKITYKRVDFKLIPISLKRINKYGVKENLINSVLFKVLCDKCYIYCNLTDYLHTLYVKKFNNLLLKIINLYTI